MASTLKLAQRLPRCSALNRIPHYSQRGLSTLSRFHSLSPISSLSRGHSHAHHPRCSCHQCFTRHLSTSAQDKEADSPSEREQESEAESTTELESDESDNEQSQQILDLESKVEQLESELKKYKDALARSHADIINIQNMNKKDVANAKKFATKAFSKDVLNVADALQGCLKVVDGGGDAVSADHIKSVIDGVRVTQTTLVDTFARHGIERIDCLNAEFDPNYHEALFKMPTDEFAPDTVCQVISEGYTSKDAVLRAAKVGVATPLPTPKEETENATDDK